MNLDRALIVSSDASGLDPKRFFQISANLFFFGKKSKKGSNCLLSLSWWSMEAGLRMMRVHFHWPSMVSKLFILENVPYSSCQGKAFLQVFPVCQLPLTVFWQLGGRERFDGWPRDCGIPRLLKNGFEHHVSCHDLDGTDNPAGSLADAGVATATGRWPAKVVVRPSARAAEEEH
jgi:hypothetical protein